MAFPYFEEPLDPQEQKDFTMDWTAYLGDATIASSTSNDVSVSSTLLTVVQTPDPAGTRKQTIRLSAGTVGSTYTVVYTAVNGDTSEIYQRTMNLLVKSL